MGENFTVADAYLFVITGWTGRMGVDIAGLETLAALQMEQQAAA